jgi:hypothetical protein
METMMKHHLSNLLLAGFVLTAAAGPALAQNPAKVCLDVREISSTVPNRDGTAIDFKMRNGATYHNALQGRCPDLWFSGFEWTIHGPDQVCDSQQSLKVLQSGQVCTLGKFTQLTPAH